MKKNSLLILINIASVILCTAQAPATLQHNGTTNVFYGNSCFQSAYDAAVNGDTINLPGGFYPPPPLIDKSLTITGAGHNPDSSLVTSKTVIQSAINLGENADNIHLEGFQISGDISIGAQISVNNLEIKRVVLNRIILSGNRSNPCINGTIRECVINGEIQLSNAAFFTLCYNFIQYRLMYCYNSIINNNIFLGGDASCCPWVYYPIYENFQCEIKNNIFYRNTGDFRASSNNQVNNNLFTNTPELSNNISSSNFYNIPVENIFTSYSENGFSYNDNFHLLTPLSYPGTDGTQVGIYGTVKPFKEGSIPVNPHFQSKTIAEQTDIDGKISLQIKVAAQNQ